MNLPSPAGVLLVDKPAGPTSHDIVARSRRALGVRRIGHTGTLDPFATGLLVLCVGQATRLSEYLTGLDKTYVATALLGQSTDTDDLEGEVVRISEQWHDLTPARIEAALSAFVGDIDQIPPAYSAKKVNGERMHRRARRGETVTLASCPITVYEARVLSIDLPRVQFLVRCSSGTYVRAIARDLGESLGCGAHLVDLRRTRVGVMDVSGSVSGDELHDESLVIQAWLPPAAALSHLPSVSLSDEDRPRFTHGQSVPFSDSLVPEDQPIAVLHGGDLLGVGTRSGDRVRPRKVLPGA